MFRSDMNNDFYIEGQISLLFDQSGKLKRHSNEGLKKRLYFYYIQAIQPQAVRKGRLANLLVHLNV